MKAGGIWRQNQHILWRHSICQPNLPHGHTSFLIFIFFSLFSFKRYIIFFFSPTFFQPHASQRSRMASPASMPSVAMQVQGMAMVMAGLVTLTARPEHFQPLPNPAPAHICVAHSHSSAVPSPLTRERGPARSPQHYINLLLSFLEASSWQTPLFAVPKELVSRVFTESCRIWLLHAVCVQGML